MIEMETNLLHNIASMKSKLIQGAILVILYGIMLHMMNTLKDMMNGKRNLYLDKF